MVEKTRKETVTRMIEMRNEGRTFQEIGEEFGISRQRVYQILQGVAEAESKEIDYYARKNHYSSEFFKKIRFVGLRKELEKRDISLLYLCKRAGVEYEKVRGPFKRGRLPANPENINKIVKFLGSTYEKVFSKVDDGSVDE